MHGGRDEAFFVRTAALVMRQTGTPDNPSLNTSGTMGRGARPIRGGYEAIAEVASPRPSDILLMTGPVVGTVTDTTANVLIEVDVDGFITCTATPIGFAGHVVREEKQLSASLPEVFHLQGLRPGTQYAVSFSPLSDGQDAELRRKGCVVRTLPRSDQIKRLRIIALSCDRPARLLEGEENPWGRLAQICKSGQCDVMLHLGDQIYTKEYDWKTSAMRIMDTIERPGVTEALRLRMEAAAAARMQEAYRGTWYPPEVATTLAHSSHLMIWSDNDVANDFTTKKKKDGRQAYTPAFLRVGMRVYRMYQRQLWDPDCVLAQKAIEHLPEVEEWHFHQYGACGIFLIDMRGNRIHPDGRQKEGPILSGRQRSAIEQAFAKPGLKCMLVCSEIPFVGDPPDVIRKKAKKVPFLKDHWPYQIEELLWLLDLCFAWKAGSLGREVIMIGGDIHVSVDSLITDRSTGQTIRHITTSPITNHVCGFYPALEGELSSRYSYVHRVLPECRTYCTIDLSFSGSSVTAEVQLVGVPVQTKNPTIEKVADALVLCGPVIGTVTETTANILLEVDTEATVTCTARPHGGGEAITDVLKLKPSVPAVFELKGLQPGTQYDVSFGPLAVVQAQELKERGCVVRTIPSADELRQLRVIALSCDRPTQLLEGQENPWGRVAQICKAGQCDIMLHLGDQVYTKDHDWMSSAMRVMDNITRPGVTDSLRFKMESRAAKLLQLAYRSTWHHDEVATALAHTSHLMIWSDNDVANDFTIKKGKDGRQAYTPAFLRVGMRVYQMYQRQLWDPECVFGQKAMESRLDVEEWHFHRYGPCGIFLIDMRGNRIRPDGVQKEGPILSNRQRQAIENAFATPGLSCMLVCSEIPFVGDPPDVIREKAKEVVFLQDHWPYQIDELIWLLDLCFGWKAAGEGRDVIMVSGDIHVSADSQIMDRQTGQAIRHIITSPITNHVCPFFPSNEGQLSPRYAYVHKVLPDVRTFCTIALNFFSGKVAADVQLVGIPAPNLPGH